MEKILSKFKLCLVLAMAIFVGKSAFAGPAIEVVGLANMANYKASDGLSFDSPKSKIGFGGGLLFDFSLGKGASFEIGGLYTPRSFDFNVTTPVAATVSQTTNWVQIPALLRFWLGSKFSIGLGGYYAIGIGKVKTSVLGVSVEQSYSEASRESKDFGLIGSLNFLIPMGSASLVIDGRYVMGLADQAQGTGKITSQDITGLIGIRFGGKNK